MATSENANKSMPWQLPAGGEEGQMLAKKSGKDFDAAWVPSKPVLLWKNPTYDNEVKSLAAQTISIPELANYEWFLVAVAPWCRTWNGVYFSGPVYLLKTKGASALTTHINANDARNIEITDDYVTFGSGTSQSTYAASSVITDESRVIPLAIYGLY